MTTKSINLFNYVRGAVRGAYGSEEFRGKAVLFVGMGEVGQEILTRLCLDGVDLYFMDHSIQNYYNAHIICGTVSPYCGQPVHITLNFHEKVLIVNGKSLDLNEIGKDSYTQGIHDFYL